jgi:hypothetical protein
MKLPRTFALVALVAFSFALTTAAKAQGCGVDDGFQGPCCAAASPTFPVFPTVTLNGLGASLKECGLDCQWNTTVTIAPTQVLCDFWLLGLSITGNGPGDPSIPGALLFGKYARTWTEFNPVTNVQVWRFLVNGDLPYAPPSPAPGSPCKYPYSVQPPIGLPAHFSGNIDFAYDCFFGTWEVAMTLTHLCVYEVHGPLSGRPLAIPAGTPPRSFHFVAPDNFAFGPGAAPQGPIVADAERESLLVWGAPYVCINENPIVAGNLQDVYCDCPCASIVPPLAPLYHHQNLNAVISSGCGSVPIASVPFPPALPTGLRYQSLGSWFYVAGSQMYPGPMEIGHYMGLLYAHRICVPGTSIAPFEAVTGVGTSNGLGMSLFNSGPPGAVYFESVDLSNILAFPSLVPQLGVPYVSDRVFSINTL